MLTPDLQPEPTKSLGRTITLYLAVLTGVVLCLCFMHTLIFPLTGAVALAVVLHRARLWLCRRMSSTMAAWLLLAAVIIAVVLPSFLVVKTLVHEVIHIARYIVSGDAAFDVRLFAVKHQKLGGMVQQGLDQLAPDAEGKRLAEMAAGWAALGLRHFITFIVQMVLMLFLLFFLLRDSDKAHRALVSMMPMPEEDALPFLRKLGEVTHAIFLGRFLIAGIQGALSGIAYWLLGVPGALLWGTLTAILCLIPAFGAFLIWVPVTIYLGFAESWTRAIILAIWGGVIVSNLDNLLYPALVGRRTELHTAVIFVAIFGGLAMFGISGFVLGPVIVAATLLLLQRNRSAAAPLAP
ncbi:AI-2E family transporter [Granulicella cerasi]|uniref:AI-2E family transporter n=1 Tax=Granulicella cerasi TaxID=741063 RepID=A0ABW1ZDB2_9BACT|nr:AI-2E family transporter [Granulicella cerasi]